VALRDRRRHPGQVGTLVAGLGDVGAGELEEAVPNGRRNAHACDRRPY